MSEYRAYRVSGRTLWISASAVLVIGLSAGVLAHFWFAHRHVNVPDPEMLMRIVIWGEQRLGERVGGLIALGSLFVASMLAWCAHVRSSESVIVQGME